MKNLNAILMVSSFLIIIWILYSTASVKFSGDNYKNNKNNNNNNNNNNKNKKKKYKDKLDLVNRIARRNLDKSKRENVLEQIRQDLNHINDTIYYDNCKYELNKVIG